MSDSTVFVKRCNEKGIRMRCVDMTLKLNSSYLRVQKHTFQDLKLFLNL